MLNHFNDLAQDFIDYIVNSSPPRVAEILGRELGPSGDSPNQRSRWKHAFSPLKHV